MEFSKQITKVYMLYHINNEKDMKLIGFFSDKERAGKIIKELVSKPGFKDYPQGFKMKAMTVDKSYYAKGFNSKCL